MTQAQEMVEKTLLFIVLMSQQAAAGSFQTETTEVPVTKASLRNVTEDLP